MIIAQVTDRFQVGGGLEHIYRIVKGMPQHRFVIFAKGGDYTQKFAALPNAELCPAGYTPELIRRFPVDLLHIHHTRPLVALLGRKRLNLPVLATVHGLHVRGYQFRKSPLSKLAYRLRFQLERRLYGNADAVIAVSQADQQFIMDEYGVENCRFIPNGIEVPETSHHPADPQSLRSRFGLDEKTFTCLTIARFDFPKGYDILVDAIQQIVRKPLPAPLCFLFVGDGELLATVRREVHRKGLDKWVKFLGRREDIDQLFRAADLFILPSRWEGLPLTILEAGAHRTPVLASDAWGIREIIRHGQNGLLFANQSAPELAGLLEKILEGVFDLDQLAVRLNQTVREQYSLAGMLEKLERIYLHYGKCHG